MSNLKDSIVMVCNDIQPCQKKIEFSLSQEVVENETKSVVKEFTNYASVPGFRKGKAPIKMLMSKYNGEILEELRRRVFSTSMDKATQTDQYEVISYAMEEGGEFPELELGKEYSFALIFDVAPEFAMPEYKGLTIEAETAEVSDDKIEEKMQQYKDMYAEFKTVTAAAAAGDMLKADYSASIELSEEASAGAQRLVKSEDGWLWLSDPEMIPGVIAALVGAESGKEYKFIATFPADFREVELAGKELEYTVNVKEVQKRVAVESEEALCEKMQVESVEELRKNIKEGLDTELDMQNEHALRSKAMDVVVEKAGSFDLPPAVLDNEVQKELKRIANAKVKTEEEAEEFKNNLDSHREEAETAAKDKLTKIFVLKKIAQAEEITVTQDEVDTQIEMLSQYYGYKVNDLRKMMDENGGMDDVQIEMMMAKVADFIVENSANKKSADAE